MGMGWGEGATSPKNDLLLYDARRATLRGRNSLRPKFYYLPQGKTRGRIF